MVTVTDTYNATTMGANKAIWTDEKDYDSTWCTNNTSGTAKIMVIKCLFCSVYLKLIILYQVSKFTFSSILLVKNRSRGSREIRLFPARMSERALICYGLGSTKPCFPRAHLQSKYKDLPTSVSVICFEFL